MSASSYLAAISAISELPRSFPVSNIPPGISLSITRNDPKLSVHVIETAREGLVKAYALSLEFSLYCKVGNTVLVLDPSPFILPNGSLNVEVFNATYRTFFHAKNNKTMKEWLDALDYPLKILNEICKTLMSAKLLCKEAANFANNRGSPCHLA